MLSSKFVTIVLISYKSKNKILFFIKNISKKFKIIIVENSNDKKLKELVKKKYKNVEIYLKKNKGYGASINYARKKIKTKYFIVFNPDVLGVNSSTIEKFHKEGIKLNDNFSCLGPRYSNRISIKQSNKKNRINKINISGAAMYFNVKKFDLLKGFDENYFLYFEENDYCLRGNKIKLYSYQLNNIKLKHFAGTSVEFKNKKEEEYLKDLRNWHFIWSKYYFYKKNYGLIFSTIYFFPYLLKLVFKNFYYILISKKNLQHNNKIRISGLIASIRGKKFNKRTN